MTKIPQQELLLLKGYLDALEREDFVYAWGFDQLIQARKHLAKVLNGTQTTEAKCKRCGHQSHKTRTCEDCGTYGQCSEGILNSPKASEDKLAELKKEVSIAYNSVGISDLDVVYHLKNVINEIDSLTSDRKEGKSEEAAQAPISKEVQATSEAKKRLISDLGYIYDAAFYSMDDESIREQYTVAYNRIYHAIESTQVTEAAPQETRA